MSDTDNSNAGEISLSLEETNALRIKLGLKPLEAGPSNAASTAENNYREQREREKKATEEKAIKDKIEKMQNRAKLSKKLEGKGLGEADATDETETSAMDWVRRSRQAERTRAKERALAAKRAKQLEEQDSIASQSLAEYSSEQLKGLKVAHDITDFQEGEEQVLVLKDSTIMDNEEEGDQLESVQLAEKSRLERNLNNKKKHLIYTGYDDEEFSTTIGKKPTILSHYDDVIDGERSKSFTLGSERTQQSQTDEQMRQTVSDRLRVEGESLDYTKMQIMSDYYTQEEADVTFRKSRQSKKGRKVRRRPQSSAVENDVNNLAMASLDEEVKPAPIVRANLSTSNLVDDDDLQKALALARNTATKKRNKRSAVEEIAEQVKRIKEEPDHLSGIIDSLDAIASGSTDNNGTLVLSDTTEFVRGLTLDVLLPTEKEADTDSNTDGLAQNESIHNATSSNDMEDSKFDYTMDVDSVVVKNEPNEDEPFDPEKAAEKEAAITEEPLVTTGLGATMALLRQKGLTNKPSERELRNTRMAQRQVEFQQMMRKQISRMDREREAEKKLRREAAAQSGKRGGQAYEREREHQEEEARYQEQRRQREWELMMRDYKPEVNLVYMDKHGNRLNAKEAYNELSHKFHGKQPGRIKTEKRLKRMTEQQRLESMPNNDTPLGAAAALQDRQKRTGMPYMVLQLGDTRHSTHIGSRSHAPDALSRDVFQ